MVQLFRCVRCKKKYASVGYRNNEVVCLFCLQLEADIKNLSAKFPSTQGIKTPHIVVHRKSEEFFQVVKVEARSCVFGTRNYYLCRQSALADVWLNEEDIRPVNEEEADAAMGWLMGMSIANALSSAEKESDEEEPTDFVPKLSANPITHCSRLLEDLRPKAIDLFSGAGGFTLGLASSFNVVGHVEFDKVALETYERNATHCGFGNSERIGKDITQISDEQIMEFKRKHRRISLVVGGPPCQGFSVAGARDPKDPRNSLFIHFVRFIRILEADAFVMENVPGMRSMKTAKGENSLEIILQAFRGAGYAVDWRILNACNYGVPQSRRRIIILGSRSGVAPTFPFPTHWDNYEG